MELELERWKEDREEERERGRCGEEEKEGEMKEVREILPRDWVHDLFIADADLLAQVPSTTLVP